MVSGLLSEIQKIDVLDYEDLKRLADFEAIKKIQG